MLRLGSYCTQVQTRTPDQEIHFKKISGEERFYKAEHYATRNFIRQTLANRPGAIVLRVCSATHAGGQLKIGNRELI